MSTFKKHKVVMLATKKESKTCNFMIHKIELENKLIFSEENNNTSVIPQHLYILSDEEIKEGKENTYYYDSNFNRITEWKGESDTYVKNYFKEVVSTTDKSLGRYWKLNEIIPLPQPPQSFVEKFVEEYNKGNVITDVMVEYDEGKFNLDELRERHLKRLPHSYDYCNLKINSKDNTINIKPIKESWNREEVETLFRRFRTDILPFGQVNEFTLNKWIEENL